VHQEATFNFAPSGSRGDRQEVEIIGIFENLLGEIRVRWRERSLEVRESLPFPFM
jgi:hypothetical protein